MEYWTHQQWGVFVTVVAAGLLAALLAPVAVRVRADLVRRRRANTVVPRHRVPPRLAALYPPYAVPVIPGEVMPDGPQLIDEIEAHLAAGPGSLVSLREVGPGSVVPVEPVVDPDIAFAVGAAIDHALDAFRCAIEPSMRTARLWMLQGGETYARQELFAWHIKTDTGEWPMVVPRGVGA